MHTGRARIRDVKEGDVLGRKISQRTCSLKEVMESLVVDVSRVIREKMVSSRQLSVGNNSCRGPQ